nr:hypothetical protein [Salinicoccus sp. RF5]
MVLAAVFLLAALILEPTILILNMLPASTSIHLSHGSLMPHL